MGFDISSIDGMDGHSFEYFCADLLRKNGFNNVSVTPGSGDQGVDIIATKDGIKYAIQCKNYSSPLGNTPVQEVFAGKTFYNCHVGVVLTNSTFTSSAVQLAESNNVILWDRNVLDKLIQNAGGLQAFGIGIEKGNNYFEDDVRSNNTDGLFDELLPSAIDVVLETGVASVSMIQRRLKLEYSRAARLIDQMEELGIVSAFEGSKPRQILITRANWLEMMHTVNNVADIHTNSFSVFKSNQVITEPPYNIIIRRKRPRPFGEGKTIVLIDGEKRNDLNLDHEIKENLSKEIHTISFKRAALSSREYAVDISGSKCVEVVVNPKVLSIKVEIFNQ